MASGQWLQLFNSSTIQLGPCGGNQRGLSVVNGHLDRGAGGEFVAAAAEGLRERAGGVGGAGADAEVRLRVAGEAVDENGEDGAAHGAWDVREGLGAGLGAAGLRVVAFRERDDGDLAAVPRLKRGEGARLDVEDLAVEDAEEFVVEPSDADPARVKVGRAEKGRRLRGGVGEAAGVRDDGDPQGLGDVAAFSVILHLIAGNLTFVAMTGPFKILLLIFFIFASTCFFMT